MAAPLPIYVKYSACTPLGIATSVEYSFHTFVKPTGIRPSAGPSHDVLTSNAPWQYPRTLILTLVTPSHEKYLNPAVAESVKLAI